METPSGSESGGVDEPQATEVTQVSVAELSRETAAAYARFFTVETPTLKADLAGLGENVNDLLARMDEFTGVVGAMRGDANQLLTVAAPPLLKHCGELQDLFEKIEGLERFVELMKHNFQTVEDEVLALERQNRTFSLGIPSVFKSVAAQLSSSPQVKKEKKGVPAGGAAWVEPEVLKTADFFVAPS